MKNTGAQPIPREVFRRIWKLILENDMTQAAIAKRCDVGVRTVELISSGKHVYQLRPDPGPSPRYLPSPEEIEAACKRLRATRKVEHDAWLPPGAERPLITAD